MLPQRIGLVTSKGSAGCNDILKTFSASGFGFKIFLTDAIVQGGKTQASVLTALDALEKLDLDLVIVARGGGSKTDLFHLDNEAIARRIGRYRYPVWTGIGHETDISILDHVANRFFKTPTAMAEDIVARFVEMKRHLDEAENRLRSTWAYRFDRDRKWLDDARTGIVQGTRKILDTTKGYLLGYATTLSSKVQNRLANETSRIAVARKIIGTAPLNLVKRAGERLREKTGHFTTSYKRQIADRHKDLTRLKGRFTPDRFMRRTCQEKACALDWRNRFMQRFRSELRIRKQRMEHLSGMFRLESVLTRLLNDKAKLANKAATLRAADPATSLKRGFALVYSDDGRLVKSVSQIHASDTLNTNVSDGRIVSTVNKTERNNDA